MLLFKLVSILLVVGIQVIAAAGERPEFAPPDILTSVGDPDATLKPHVGNPVEAYDAIDADETRSLRWLLVTRRSCPSGHGLCTDGG